MVNLYVNLYEKGLREIEQIPSPWQTDVVKKLIEKETLREEDIAWAEKVTE